jgi:hypothetical protein
MVSTSTVSADDGIGIHQAGDPGFGSYAVADCYRLTRDKKCPDTAGIQYGVTGVCHQTANRFLYAGNTCLDPARVKGMQLTILTFGPLGKDAVSWYKNIYTPCAKKAGITLPAAADIKALEFADAGKSGDGMLPNSGKDSCMRFQAIYVEAASRSVEPDPNELIMQATAVDARHRVPEVDPESIRDVQRGFLHEMDIIQQDAVAGRTSIEQRDERINELGYQIQQDLARVLGVEQYEKFMGVPVGEPLSIIDQVESSSCSS